MSTVRDFRATRFGGRAAPFGGRVRMASAAQPAPPPRRHFAALPFPAISVTSSACRVLHLCNFTRAAFSHVPHLIPWAGVQALGGWEGTFFQLLPPFCSVPAFAYFCCAFRSACRVFGTQHALCLHDRPHRTNTWHARARKHSRAHALGCNHAWTHAHRHMHRCTWARITSQTDMCTRSCCTVTCTLTD